MIKPGVILDYLQTLLYEERVIVVQIDGSTQVFFATLWEKPHRLEDTEGENGQPMIDPDYERRFS